MAHWTNTAACSAEGGLVTFEQVLGARASYSGSIVNGPEMLAGLPPEPSPPALLHPNGVSSVRTKKQSAIGRTQVLWTIIDSPPGSHFENLRNGNMEPRAGAVVARRFHKKAGLGLEARFPLLVARSFRQAARIACAIRNEENEGTLIAR
jgi:hypothetical protein